MIVNCLLTLSSRLEFFQKKSYDAKYVKSLVLTLVCLFLSSSCSSLTQSLRCGQVSSNSNSSKQKHRKTTISTTEPYFVFENNERFVEVEIGLVIVAEDDILLSEKFGQPKIDVYVPSKNIGLSETSGSLHIITTGYYFSSYNPSFENGPVIVHKILIRIKNLSEIENKSIRLYYSVLDNTNSKRKELLVGHFEENVSLNNYINLYREKLSKMSWFWDTKSE